MNLSPRHQQGFTLIELMIAMVLALIITAAVTQIYITAIRTSSAQRAAAGILDANVYGLQQIEKNLRMAGLGFSDVSKLNYLCGGVLITNGTVTTNCDGSPIGGTSGGATGGSASSSTTDPTTRALKDITNLMTKADGGPTNTSNSNSPQLTIQYRAPETMVDCEGKVALGVRQAVITDANDGLPTHVDGQVVIERYFVKDNNGTLELRCDAGRYITEEIASEPNVAAKNQSAVMTTSSQVKDFGDDGALVISGIDDFQIRLGVKSSASSGIQHMSIANYTASTAPVGQIVSVQLGVLAKGQVATSQADAPPSSTYTLFGNSVSINSTSDQNFIRRVYESNVMLRNSRGTL